jgi:beta-lactam-binding protein with PASTA domain
VIEDGVTPDLVGQHLLVAITDLTDADMQYVVVEVDNESGPSGIIFNQSPLAGTPLADDTVVTVLASR